MFNAPVPPRFLITRQITCISCQEVFVIAEDDAEREDQNFDRWRLPRDYQAATQLRYLPDRTRRSITPETGSQPDHNPTNRFSPWDEEQLVNINCPRCGADNRNWLHLAGISESPLKQFPALRICVVVLFVSLVAATVLHFDLPAIWRSLTQGEPWPEFTEGELRRILSLIIAIFLAGYLPLVLISPQWKRLREYIHLQKVRTTRPIIDISPPARTGLSLFIIFVFLVPFVLFILIPWTFNRGIVLLAPEREPTLVQRLDQISRDMPAAISDTPEEEIAPVRNAITSLEALLNEQAVPCERLQIEAMIEQMQLLTMTNSDERRAGLIADVTTDLEALRNSNECRAELVENANASLQILLDFEEEECARARSAAATTTLPSVCNTILITDIVDNLPDLQDEADPSDGDESGEEDLRARADHVLSQVRELVRGSVDTARVQRIETDLGALESFIESEEQGWFTAGRDFLRDWFWLVGLVSLTSIIISLDAIDRYARGIDHHLPRPIFYSVANMTRVTIWEAKRSLEVGDIMNQVCWTRVERSPNGGIVLCGLHYDSCKPDKNRDALHQRVRAQCYIIYTDAWGRIQRAEVKDTHVQRPPESPDSSLSEELFGGILISSHKEHVSTG